VPESRIFRANVVEALAYFQEYLTQLHSDTHEQGASTILDGVSICTGKDASDQRWVELDCWYRVIDDHLSGEGWSASVPFEHGLPGLLRDHDKVTMQLN
jgi:hypothetical protein